jgi:Zn-dependent protease with chaperone function
MNGYVVILALAMLSGGCARNSGGGALAPPGAVPKPLSPGSPTVVTGPAGAGDDVPLPPYLWTAVDAAAVRTLFEAFQQPDPSYGDVTASETQDADPGIPRYTNYMEENLAAAMRIQALAPGRNFHVFVAQAEFSNAFDTGFATIQINGPTATTIPGSALIPAICHEMAHSAQNHLVARWQYLTSGEYAPAYAEMSKLATEYLNAHYNPTTGVYVHDVAAYDAVRQVYESAAGQAIGAFIKRQESTADILGGMICAEMGMAPADYISGMRTVFSAIDAVDNRVLPSFVKPRLNLPDGATLTLDEPELSSVIRSMDDHPTTDERLSQLTRLSSYLDSHLNPQVGVATTWIDGYEAHQPTTSGP